jgi:hypothetical protein
MTRGQRRYKGEGPYYVAVRAAERRILRDALATFGNDRDAANALGIEPEYFRVKSIHLGGVYEGQPEREPPGPISVARANARAEGVPIAQLSPNKPLRRFGRELKRRQPTTKKAKKHVEQRNGDDPAHRVSGDPEREVGGGAPSSGGGEPAEDGKDCSEQPDDVRDRP